jgi:hypothetical protein
VKHEAKGAHQRTKQSCKFSLCFIPLFSVGTKYLDSCTVCGRIIEVSKQPAETAALYVSRICGNSDLPSGCEIVSTESDLLSAAVDRI